MNAFEIKIRPETALLPVALGAVSAYAKLFFKNKKDVDRIVLATEEAINNVLSYSVTTRMQEITVAAEGADGEFTVYVLDKGLPGDYEKTLTGEDRLGLTLMHGVVDEAAVENLGMDGRRQKLVKYYSRMPEFAALPRQPEPEFIDGAEISVRAPKKDEMLEICRAFYNEYGLTYVNDLIYYPERFYAAVAKDQIHSTIAVDQHGRFAGHHGVFQWTNVPGVWEAGMAVVNSSFRNAGVFKKMMARTYAYVHDEVKGKLFLGCCITTHPYSQKLRLKYDSFPCGFSFNAVPPELAESTFKGASDFSTEALAASAFDFTPKSIYLPEELHTAARFIYGGMNLTREFSPETLSLPETPTKSAWFFNNRLRIGSINFSQPGSDYATRLRSDIYELKTRGAEMITLYLSVELAGLQAAYEAAKAEGFFFTGILPNADQGDVLIMQKMVNHVVNYDSLITTGPFTELLDIVRAFDPDQQK